jgi:hypothetical protein
VQHRQGQRDEGGEKERRAGSQERVIRQPARVRGGRPAQGVARRPRHDGREGQWVVPWWSVAVAGCRSGRMRERTARNKEGVDLIVRARSLKTGTKEFL